MTRVKRNLFILCLSCIISVSYAVDSDQQQPLLIASDTADLNSQTGIGIYTGNVTIDQGSTHVRGDKVTSYSENNKITLVVAEGDKKKQARYENTVDPNKPPLIAIADIIKFFPQKNYAILLGHAYVQQGENSIAGEHLEYDLTNKILKSINAPNTKAVRTRIVIDPNNLPETDPTPQ
ncbi:MAG: hypothetical protein K0R48_570 [Gammaproteobacteria bacterium]|jgi:lipopolysaccharide export system protein LptA|nr:hypothetical protein [Gammaproteobacteria bacterium]